MSPTVTLLNKQAARVASNQLTSHCDSQGGSRGQSWPLQKSKLHFSAFV